MYHLRHLMIAACAALSLCGCRSETAVDTGVPMPQTADNPPAASSEAPATSPETSAAPEVASKEIALEVVDKEGFQKAIDKHRGKVVLVDVWATWCPPCVKMFPHTVELANKYADKGLAVISLSMDDQDAHEDALAFLKEQKATFTNLRSKSGVDEQAIEAFDIDGGVLPHFKVYDRQGKPVKKLAGGEGTPPPEAEDIDKAVEALLAEQ